MKKFNKIIIYFFFFILLLPLTSFAQFDKEIKTFDKKQNFDFNHSLKLSEKLSNTNDLRSNFEKNIYKKNSVSKKNPALAFLYSLAVPGLGQIYTKRFDVGKYYLISEAALWLGFASFTVYSNWLENDALNYAVNHAGINKDGKDNDYFVNIGNYDNVYQYNDDKLRFGEYDKVYFPNSGFDFYWDTIENRRKFREDYLASTRIKTDRMFIVGAIFINHLVSAISALILTNGYNSDLQKKLGSLSVNASVISTQDKIHGLKLNLTKWF